MEKRLKVSRLLKAAFELAGERLCGVQLVDEAVIDLCMPGIDLLAGPLNKQKWRTHRERQCELRKEDNSFDMVFLFVAGKVSEEFKKWALNTVVFNTSQRDH